MQELVNELIEKGKTIATMESCTGGELVNAITNIAGASEVLKFSAVTYCNEYKIKMGVSSDTINKYGVYSINVAREMALQISNFTNSDYGIGITGKLNRVDKYNLVGQDNIVFISIYDKFKTCYHDITVEVKDHSRKDNKETVINEIVSKMLEII